MTTNTKLQVILDTFQPNLFLNKIVLLTGGHSGITYGFSEAFHQLGANLILLGRKEEKLKKAQSKLMAMQQNKNQWVDWISGDIRNAKQIKEKIKKMMDKHQLNHLDVLVNGAAGNFLASAEDLSTNAFARVVEIDLLGTFNVCKACLEYLKHDKEPGQIINISATLPYTCVKFQVHSSAAKAGVDVLTRNLAVEWGDQFGIRVNGIAPGPIEGTPGMERLSGGKDVSKQSKKAPRVGTIYDIASTAVFLCSPMGRFISGETIVVDGTFWLRASQFVSDELYQKVRRSRM